LNANNKGQVWAHTVCERYAGNFDAAIEKGTCLVLCGKPGTGKTHLAAAICNHLILSGGRSVVFSRVYSAIRAIKDTYRRDCETTEQEVLEAFVSADLLVLDEVGVQFGSDTERLLMFEIINGRYDKVKPTILISNLSAGEIEDFIGERIMDRLMEGGGVVVPFDWQSERRVSR